MSAPNPLQMPKGTRALAHQKGVNSARKSPAGRKAVKTPNQEASSRQNSPAGTRGSMSQRRTLKAPTSKRKQQGKGLFQVMLWGERTKMAERVTKAKKRRVMPTKRFLRNYK